MFQDSLQSEHLVKMVPHEVNRCPNVRVLNGNRVGRTAGNNAVRRYSYVKLRHGPAIHEMMQHAGRFIADFPGGA